MNIHLIGPMEGEMRASRTWNKLSSWVEGQYRSGGKPLKMKDRIWRDRLFPIHAPGKLGDDGAMVRAAEVSCGGFQADELGGIEDVIDAP